MFKINKCLPMTGFEPQTSDIGSDRSTNWATTTAHCVFLLAWPSQDVFLLPHIPWIGQRGSILLVLSAMACHFMNFLQVNLYPWPVKIYVWMDSEIKSITLAHSIACRINSINIIPESYWKKSGGKFQYQSVFIIVTKFCRMGSAREYSLTL